MTCLYDRSSSEQFIFKNENLIELLFGQSEKKIPLKSDSLPLYMYSIHNFLDNRNIPEYTEVRLDRNCYFTAALAAAMEIEEVNLKAAAEKEFKSSSPGSMLALTLCLIILL